MKGALVRVGIDQEYGKWNAPMDPNTNQFIYIPITEKMGTRFEDGLDLGFNLLIPTLEKFTNIHNKNLYNDLKFPKKLLYYKMHLDPDFEYLTYGDRLPRGKELATMDKGDLIIFYAGLKPIALCNHNLVYSLIGLYVVDKVLRVKKISHIKWKENAHTRKLHKNKEDIIIKADPKYSGRLTHCIPIGEWRNRSYRVRRDVLKEWGGLTVKDGYIQRSAVPPLLKNPEKFYSWFKEQNISLISKNN